MKHLSKHHRALSKLQRQRGQDTDREAFIAQMIADGLTREQAERWADEEGIEGMADLPNETG